MPNITGYYEFHRGYPAQHATIINVDQSGQLVSASIDDRLIHGQYDASTNAITFNDARNPTDVLYVTNYTGYVMPDGGDICAMAGTYQELAVRFKPTPGFTTVHGSWYAVWQGPH